MGKDIDAKERELTDIILTIQDHTEKLRVIRRELHRLQDKESDLIVTLTKLRHRMRDLDREIMEWRR